MGSGGCGRGNGVEGEVRRGEEAVMRACVRAYLAGFVLCDFVLGVLLALFAFAVGAAGFLGGHAVSRHSFFSFLPWGQAGVV